MQARFSTTHSARRNNGEVYLGLPPYLVLIGGLPILAATILLGVAVVQMRLTPEGK